MIIGLEWITFALLLVALASILIVGIFGDDFPVLATSMTVLSVLSLVSSICLFCGLLAVQSKVKDRYIDYLKLQTQVAQYDDLDMFEQYKVYTEVMYYNTWYGLNKESLENEWSFKGSSDYAKEFDYIVIGGK